MDLSILFCTIYLSGFFIYGWLYRGMKWDVAYQDGVHSVYNTFTNGLSFKYVEPLGFTSFIHGIIVFVVGVGMVIQYYTRKTFRYHVLSGLIMFNLINVLYIQGIYLQSKSAFSIKSIISNLHGLVGIFLNVYGLYCTIAFKNHNIHLLSTRYIWYQFKSATFLNPIIWAISTFHPTYIHLLYDVVFVLLTPFSIYYLHCEYKDILSRKRD
jgi:hypothetical protein